MAAVINDDIDDTTKSDNLGFTISQTDGPVLCPIKGLKRKHPDKVFLVMKFLS